MEPEDEMRKELKDEICNFLMLFLAAGLGAWFVYASVIAVQWMMGLL